MLNSAADYKCVDVTGLSGFISGDIMPVRDNRGDGSWRAMKYEDLLFLQEAKAEREHWDSPRTSFDNDKRLLTKVTPYGRILKGSNTYSASISENPISNNCKLYIDKDHVMTTTSEIRNLNLSQDVQYPSSEFFDAVANELGGFFDPIVPNFSQGNPLSVEEIRKAMWNVKNATRTLKRVDFISSTTLNIPQRPSSTFTAFNGLNTAVSYDNGNTPNAYYVYWTKPTSVGCSTSSNDLGWFPWANGAWLVMPLLGTRYRDYRVYNGNTYGHDYYDIETSYLIGIYRLDIVDGVVRPPSSWNGIIDDFCSRSFDVVLPATYRNSQGSRHASPSSFGDDAIDINASAYFCTLLMVDNDFPAEIDSLNWNWQPT